MKAPVVKNVRIVGLRLSAGFVEGALTGEITEGIAHVWVRAPIEHPDELRLGSGPLYVNPYDEGASETREWTTTSRRGSAVVDVLFAVAAREAAMSKALAEHHSRVAKAEAFRLACAKRHAMLEVIDENLDLVLAIIGNAETALAGKIRAAADRVTS